MEYNKSVPTLLNEQDLILCILLYFGDYNTQLKYDLPTSSLISSANIVSSLYSGGKSKKYTVKYLKSIAKKNNIKTTKKVDNKTVALDKKALMAKLKRKKLL